MIKLVLFMLLLSTMHVCRAANNVTQISEHDLRFSVTESWVQSLQQAYDAYLIFNLDVSNKPLVMHLVVVKKFLTASEKSFNIIKEKTIDTLHELKVIVKLPLENVKKLFNALTKTVILGNRAHEVLLNQKEDVLAGSLSRLVNKIQIALEITSSLIPFTAKNK
uniref:Uncharacterized protein n=1 Tax=Strigamia maritima TaxID=126957 RepID=T1IRF9_STRMM